MFIDKILDKQKWHHALKIKVFVHGHSNEYEETFSCNMYDKPSNLCIDYKTGC